MPDGISAPQPLKWPDIETDPEYQRFDARGRARVLEQFAEYNAQFLIDDEERAMMNEFVAQKKQEIASLTETQKAMAEAQTEELKLIGEATKEIDSPFEVMNKVKAGIPGVSEQTRDSFLLATEGVLTEGLAKFYEIPEEEARVKLYEPATALDHAEYLGRRFGPASTESFLRMYEGAGRILGGNEGDFEKTLQKDYGMSPEEAAETAPILKNWEQTGQDPTGKAQKIMDQIKARESQEETISPMGPIPKGMLPELELSAKAGLATQKESQRRFAQSAAEVREEGISDIPPDPRIYGTDAGSFLEGVAQMPANLATSMIPGVRQAANYSQLYAEAFDQAKQIAQKKGKPITDEQAGKLATTAAALNLPMEELADTFLLGKWGKASKRLLRGASKAAFMSRVLARMASKATMEAGTEMAQQGVTNWMTDAPLEYQMRQAGFGGAGGGTAFAMMPTTDPRLNDPKVRQRFDRINAAKRNRAARPLGPQGPAGGTTATQDAPISEESRQYESPAEVAKRAKAEAAKRAEEEGITPDPEEEMDVEEEAPQTYSKAGLEAYLRETYGIKTSPNSKIQVVFEPETMEYGRLHVEIAPDGTNTPTMIEINAAFTESPQDADNALHHELSHAVSENGEMGDALQQLTQDERLEIEQTMRDLGYESGDKKEFDARGTEMLSKAFSKRGWFKQLVGKIQVLANKMGIKLGRLGAEAVAARAIGRAFQDFRAGTVSQRSLDNINRSKGRASRVQRDYDLRRLAGDRALRDRERTDSGREQIDYRLADLASDPEARARARAIRAREAMRRIPGARGDEALYDSLTDEEQVIADAFAGLPKVREGVRVPVERGEPEPTAPNQAAMNRKPRRFKALNPYDSDGKDILDFIAENGGIKLPKKGAELRDDLPENLVGAYRQLATYDGTHEPDAMAKILRDEDVLVDGDVGEMYEAMGKAIAARTRMRAERKAWEKREKQTERFNRDIRKKRKGDTLISVADLQQGDVIEVNGEPMEVRSIDPESFNVILDGGEKYGVQEVEANDQIYGVVTEQAAVDDGFDTGENADDGFSLEEQTEETIKADQAKALKKKQAEEIKARAAERLTGDAGDLTADMFGEGETPLFNNRRDNPNVRQSRVTPKQDAEYMAAVEAGDMETAQRMVDEAAKKAGYNVGPVYHKTNGDFTEFDLSKASKSAVWGPAIYASFEGDWNPSSLKGGKTIKGFVGGKVIDMTKPLPPEDTETLSKFLGRDVKDGVPFISLERRFGSVAEGLAAAGYSAAIHNGPGGKGTHIAVLDPSQIKSADPVTRDASGNVIPLSERFNTRSNDIRYSRVSPEQQELRDFQKIDREVRQSRRVPRPPFTPGNIGIGPRDLPMWNRFLRLFNAGSWASIGYLRQVADRTANQNLARPLRALADRIAVVFDQEAVYSSSTISPIARWKRTTTAKQQKAAEGHFAEFQRIANSMDGSNAATAAARIAANQQRAMAYLARLPAKSQELIKIAMDNAVYQGTEMDSHAVHVQDGRRWRRAVNLGQWFFPRRLSARVQEVLSDRGDAKNRQEFERMLREMVSNGNAATLTEARDILVSEASNGMSGGEFFGSLDRARGTKLPDSFYDYTFAGYLDHLQGWSKRMAQIHAFGQRMDETMPPAFMRASQVAEDQSLQSRIRAWYDEIYGQKAELKPAERVVAGYVLPLAAVLYLTGTMTQIRNLVSGQAATAENFGYRRLLMADFRAMWDTISALTQMGRNATQGDFRLLEPQLVADAADMGAVKRGLYGVIYDLDENSTWAQRLANKVMTPQQLAEMMNRSVTAHAALVWLQDAQRAIRANPTSRRSLQARALMQRWGFDGLRQRELTQSNPRPETVRQFIRKAVDEKQFPYNLTTTPSFMSNNVMTKLLTQFQKWSAQKSRDLHRNVFAPAFAGEVVETRENGRTVRRRVRTIAPLVRMILSTSGTVALVNAIQSAVFGRKDRDASWEEIYNTATEDEQRGMQVAVATFLKDMTATGSFGIHWDHFRQIGDTLNPGRRKDLVNPPGFAIVKSVIELAQAQKERGGDPKAFARDFKEILLNKIPIAREIQDGVLTWVVDDENYYAMVKQGKEDLAVAKGLLRRYIEETGGELEDYTGRQPKNKNTEFFDRMNEALLIGDLELANEVKQDFLNEGGNLRSLKSSVQRRAPLVKTGNIKREDEQDFLDWVERRVPSKSAIIEDINTRYHQAAEAIGLENPR